MLYGSRFDNEHGHRNDIDITKCQSLDNNLTSFSKTAYSF